VSRPMLALITACFGITVILSGLYRYFMEPGGSAGLWFGLVMGGLALVGAILQLTKVPAVGDVLAVLAAIFVGGWFCFENFGKSKHEIRMYLMIIASIVELVLVGVYWCRRKKPVEDGS